MIKQEQVASASQLVRTILSNKINVILWTSPCRLGPRQMKPIASADTKTKQTTVRRKLIWTNHTKAAIMHQPIITNDEPVIRMLFRLARSHSMAGQILVLSMTRCIPAVLMTIRLCGGPSPMSSFSLRQPRPLSAHDLSFCNTNINSTTHKDYCKIWRSGGHYHSIS